MSRESRKHFSHRKGNGLVTSKKSSGYQKVRHSISTPERCFKNRRWLGKDRAQNELLTSNKIHLHCDTLKWACNIDSNWLSCGDGQREI